MTQKIITIGSNTYLQTLDDQGNQIALEGRDPVPTIVVLTRYEYRRLFTMAERIAVDNYQTNANLTQQQKDEIAAFLNDFQIADTIPLSDPPVVQGTQFLETCGLITTGRAAQILANQPAPSS